MQKVVIVTTDCRNPEKELNERLRPLLENGWKITSVDLKISTDTIGATSFHGNSFNVYYGVIALLEKL